MISVWYSSTHTLQKRANSFAHEFKRKPNIQYKLKYACRLQVPDSDTILFMNN